MEQLVCSGFRKDPALRSSFNQLSKQIFCLDFEPWYQNGFWTDAFNPHSVVRDGEVVSNISVNKMDFLLNGVPRHYIQLGTVMTRPDCRGQGLSRLLMEQILREYAGADGIYLFGNDSVLNFYPKFGFISTPEYRYNAPIPQNSTETAISVPMQNAADWAAFLQNIRGLCANSVLEMQNDGLLMFYLSQMMKSCVYYLPAQNAFAVAEKEAPLLTLYGVWSAQPLDLLQVAAAFGRDFRTVALAFPPLQADGFRRVLHREEDCTFFCLGQPLSGDIPFFESFPGLSHA